LKHALQKMGIPTAAIVALDILKDADLTPLLHAAFVPAQLIDSWGILKRKVTDEFQALGLDMKKAGVEGLSTPAQEAANNLISNIAGYGIFIVPVGEIERWLPDIGGNVTKQNWLSVVFDKMGTDRADPQYLHPQPGDVWDFVRLIARWIANPHRKGIPE
jgi:hypothetical protein